jgi:hypothetical protein
MPIEYMLKPSKTNLSGMAVESDQTAVSDKANDVSED